MDKIRAAVTRRPIAVQVLVVLVTLGTSLLLWVYPKIYPVRTTSITVDMKADAGNVIEVYLNGSGQPLRQKIAAKKRNLYTFPLDEDVEILRLDPTDVAGAEVNIYSIAIEDAQGVLRHFSPEELRLWDSYNLRSREVIEGSFHSFSANVNPAVASMVHAKLRNTAADRVASYAARLSTPQFLPSLIALSFIVLLSIALLSPSRSLHLPLACSTVLAVLGIIPVLVARCSVLAEASTSVGSATFFGRSLRANQIAVLLTVIVAGLLAIAAWLLFRRLQRAPLFASLTAAVGNDGVSSLPAVPRKPVVMLAPCLLALIYFPDLRETAAVFQNRLFPQDWDWYNLTYWAYLAHKGFLPLRDFWYPYAGLYVFDLPLPTGEMLRWLYMWILFSVFFVSFYRLSGYRLAAAIPATALMVIGDRGHLLADSYRYLLAVDLVLSYLAIDHSRPDWRHAAIWFWVSCLLALFFEPAQIVYGGGAIAVKLVLDFWQDRPRQWPRWRKRLWWEFAPPLALGVLVSGWLALNGQLRPFLNFQLRLGDLTTYSAVPTDLMESFKNPLGINFLAVALPPLLIAIGLFERFRNQKPTTHADALLGLGLVGFLLCQKHLVREVAPEMLPVFLAALLAYALLGQARRSCAEYLLASMIAGVFLLLTIQTGAAEGVLRSLISSPRKIIDSIRLIGSENRLLDEANRQAYAPERFALFPEELNVNAWIRKQANGERAQVFALGDDAMLYILRRQPPVYLPNLYNASPRYEQEALVRWLQATKPEYVTFDPTAPVMDGIPYAVRCPLVFEHVINSYVPERVVGKTEILRRKLPSEPIALAYWRDKLGAVLDLGHLPRVSSISRFRPCQSNSGTGCVDFVRIHLATPHPNIQAVALPVEADSFTFNLQFQTLPFKDTYYVLLDRVWFWKVVKDRGGSVSIPTQRLPDGVEIEMVSKQDLQDVLY